MTGEILNLGSSIHGQLIELTIKMVLTIPHQYINTNNPDNFDLLKKITRTAM